MVGEPPSSSCVSISCCVGFMIGTVVVIGGATGPGPGDHVDEDHTEPREPQSGAWLCSLWNIEPSAIVGGVYKGFHNASIVGQLSENDKNIIKNSFALLENRLWFVSCCFSFLLNRSMSSSLIQMTVNYYHYKDLYLLDIT